MKKRLIPIFILIAYAAILIKIMVFKDVPLIRVGVLMLNFGGVDASHPANFIPFKTILPYLLGYKGLLIAGINLAGNIGLLIPIGFLIPFIYKKITWKKSLILAAASGLLIETMQAVLHVGIFDIDDVILNALGVMIGYWVYAILAKWLREKNYKSIIIYAAIAILAAAAVIYFVYPKGGQVVNPGASAGDVQSDRFNNEQEGPVPQSGDLCGDTGGAGQIISLDNNAFTINKNDDNNQIVHLSDQATINTSDGPGSAADLKIEARVTIVGGPNPDGSFTADAVFICNPSGSENR